MSSYLVFANGHSLLFCIFKNLCRMIISGAEFYFLSLWLLVFHRSCLFMINAFLCCRKLRDVLQQRLIKFFVDQSKKDTEKYAKFFEDYGLFMREGIVTTTEQEVKVGSKFLGLSLGCLGLWRKLVAARNLSFPGHASGVSEHPS